MSTAQFTACQLVAAERDGTLSKSAASALAALYPEIPAQQRANLLWRARSPKWYGKETK